MNKDLLEFSHSFIEEAAPQLRLFAYAEWAGWLLVGICLIVTTIVFWKLREKITIRGSLEDFPLGWLLFAFSALLSFIFILMFIPFTIKVITNPELVGFKLLLPQ